MDYHDCNNCGFQCDCGNIAEFCESCESCVADPVVDDYESDYDDDSDDLDDNWTAPIVTFDDDGSDEGSDG